VTALTPVAPVLDVIAVFALFGQAIPTLMKIGLR
jgi:hypothetical protein